MLGGVGELHLGHESNDRLVLLLLGHAGVRQEALEGGASLAHLSNLPRDNFNSFQDLLEQSWTDTVVDTLAIKLRYRFGS